MCVRTCINAYFSTPWKPMQNPALPRNSSAMSSFSKFAPRGHQGLWGLERWINAVSWDQQGGSVALGTRAGGVGQLGKWVPGTCLLLCG